MSLGSPNTDWICESAVLDALADAEPAALFRYDESSSASRARVMPATLTPVPTLPYGNTVGSDA